MSVAEKPISSVTNPALVTEGHDGSKCKNDDVE